MRFIKKLQAHNQLWAAFLLLVVGILISVYLGVWAAVAALGVLAFQAAVGIYVLNKKNASSTESQNFPARPDVSSVFGNTLVRDVMVPRTDMVTVFSNFSVDDSLDLMLFNGFSRIPVCGEGIDDIQGTLHSKDLMSASRDKNGNMQVSEIMREANFVPETKRISELLQEMQSNTFHVAIAIDEYGGTAGLVTLEDLIEEIVGEITDEFDIEAPLIERLGENEYRVNGRVSVAELSDTLGVEVPEGSWSTMGGFIFTSLGHIPEEGEKITASGYIFCVEKVQGRRIARVRVSPGV